MDSSPIRHVLLSPQGEAVDDLARATLRAGGTVIRADPMAHPGRLLAELERTRATHLTLTSALLRILAAEPAVAMTDLSTLRRIIHIGPSEPADLARAAKILGAPLVHVPSDPPSEPGNAALIDAAGAAADAATGPVDAERVTRFVQMLDDAVLASMLLSLQRNGILDDSRVSHPVAEILRAARVASAHTGLIGRWLRVFAERGVLARDGERYLGTEPVDADAVAGAWDRVRRCWVGQLGDGAFVDYLRHNAERLGELMSGEQQAALLLFPEGRTDLADAVYRNTITACYLNTAVATLVRRLATDRPLRMLEVGAGTGATTDAILRALGRDPDVGYLFTDVSNFFLTSARARLSGYPWIQFGLFDIDRDPGRQGLRPETFDVVIAAGVLNNARDTDATVRAVAELLVPGGWLLITEPTREHLEILASQAFMMTDAQDARLSSGSTFLSAGQWQDVFTGAGVECLAMLPGEDHPLAPLGQRLFVVRA